MSKRITTNKSLDIDNCWRVWYILWTDCNLRWSLFFYLSQNSTM